MSCSSCSCNPCTCDVCDPNNEPLASALNNFIASFFGSISKTCVDNQVQWILPCDLNTGLAGFERRQGEGVACYLLRLFEFLNAIATSQLVTMDEGVVISNATASFNFTGGGVTATAAGNAITVNIPTPVVPGCADFLDVIAINGTCYDTWQAAYDANVGATTPTIMLVGQGSTFGDLVLTGNYNSNIIPVGFGVGVSQLGNITGAGFTVAITAHQLTLGTITSSGAAVTLGGADAVFGAVSTANGAGAGGAIAVGANLTTGSLTSTGTAVGGAVTLGREVSVGAILATGSTGGSVTIGDECTGTTITSKPLSGGGTGGVITLADDCTFTTLDNSGTVAGTFGGATSIGDRCETGSITGSGVAAGGNLTTGEDCKTLSIDISSSVSGNGGNLTLGARNFVTGTATCSGAVNGGIIIIGLGSIVTSTISGVGASGTGGPVTIGAGGAFGDLNFASSGNTGALVVGKFCTTGAIMGGSSTGMAGATTIGDGCTINGLITRSSVTTGAVTLGNSVTVTGNMSFSATTGTTGLITTGRGCNLQNVSNDTSNPASGTTGGITIGASTTALAINSSTTSNSTTAGSITIGAGASVTTINPRSVTAGGSSGAVIMEPGSTCTTIDTSSVSGTGGAVTLKNANVVTGTITQGTSNPGTIIAVNARIQDQIDNVNGSSIFRDSILSTPAGNRDCIANLTANGSQYTNCLMVPNGTGNSIDSTVARTVIAYQLLHRVGFSANVTLSEGSETVSPNFVAP